MTRTLFVGVDPGAHGGLVIIPDPIGRIRLFNTPNSLQGIWDLVYRLFARNEDRVLITLEKVAGFIGSNKDAPNSRKKNLASAHTMFPFGVNYGAWQMAFIGNNRKVEKVTPQMWQGRLGVPPRRKGEPKSSFKGRLKRIAQRLYPDINITLATCDALLLAEYGRRVYRQRSI